MNKGLIIFHFLSLVFACNQAKENETPMPIFNKILVPIIIQWDTIPDGFGEGLDLLHKEFEILFITEKSVIGITTNNEIQNDSLLILQEQLNSLKIYPLIDIKKNKIIYLKDSNKDSIVYNVNNKTIEMNTLSYIVCDKVSNHSYIRLKNIINPNKNGFPSEIQLPK